LAVTKGQVSGYGERLMPLKRKWGDPQKIGRSTEASEERSVEG